MAEKMDDSQSDPKKRKVHAHSSARGGVAPCTLEDIHSVLEEHAHQIEALVAANKVLEGRNVALEERCKALDRKYDALVGKFLTECRDKCGSLERKYGVLEVRCSSLERSIQVLKKDVDWTYSAPDIPRSHWIEQGQDEDYAANVEECLMSIKCDADRIRSLGVDYSNCLDNMDNMAILHDDALLPHFKELADAIQLSNGIEQINIDSFELHPSALGILFPAMEGKVTSIDIRCIRIPDPDVDECYEIIAASIRRNHALNTLEWIDNRIPSDEQADLLIESVIGNRSIKYVKLENCFDQSEANGCRALASLMMCGRHLTRIDFSDNRLSSVDYVAAALATNPQLEELNLIANDLNDSDAELIAGALKQNTILRLLDLRRNNMITAIGIEKIETAIYDPSSLNAMASCNHTCYIDIGGGYKNVLTPQENRRHKLYKIFSTRHSEGSNSRHLNSELGVGIFVTKLVPSVLESIGRSYVLKPLSLYFELIRNWKMPELYEHRGTFEDD